MLVDVIVTTATVAEDTMPQSTAEYAPLINLLHNFNRYAIIWYNSSIHRQIPLPVNQFKLVGQIK